MDKIGWSKKSHRGPIGAPGPLSLSKSEADFSELDENAHMAVDNMNEDEVNDAFEKMLVTLHDSQPSGRIPRRSVAGPRKSMLLPVPIIY